MKFIKNIWEWKKQSQRENRTLNPNVSNEFNDHTNNLLIYSKKYYIVYNTLYKIICKDNLFIYYYVLYIIYIMFYYYIGIISIIIIRININLLYAFILLCIMLGNLLKISYTYILMV